MNKKNYTFPIAWYKNANIQGFAGKGVLYGQGSVLKDGLAAKVV